MSALLRLRAGMHSPACYLPAISKLTVTVACSVFSPGAIGICVPAGWASARLGTGAKGPNSSSIENTWPSVTPAARA